MAEAQAAGQGSIGIGRATQLGSLLYLVLGVGMWVTLFLVLTIASDQSLLGVSLGSGDEMYTAAFSAYEYFLFIAPFLAVVLAGFLHLSGHAGNQTAQFSAAIGLVGTIVSMIILVILMTAFAPSGASVDIVDELPGIIAIAVGAGILGGVSGLVFDQFP